MFHSAPTSDCPGLAANKFILYLFKELFCRRGVIRTPVVSERFRAKVLHFPMSAQRLCNLPELEPDETTLYKAMFITDCPFIEQGHAIKDAPLSQAYTRFQAAGNYFKELRNDLLALMVACF